jgi:hypothetical protein
MFNFVLETLRKFIQEYDIKLSILENQQKNYVYLKITYSTLSRDPLPSGCGPQLHPRSTLHRNPCPSGQGSSSV